MKKMWTFSSASLKEKKEKESRLFVPDQPECTLTHSLPSKESWLSRSWLFPPVLKDGKKKGYLSPGTRVRLQTHRQPSGLSCEELISNSGGGKFDRHSG